MRRTGQIPPLRLRHRKPPNVGPTVKEADLVLVLLTRQRMAISAALEALEYSEGDERRTNRNETESRKWLLSGLFALHECVARWLPDAMRTEEKRREWNDRR